MSHSTSLSPEFAASLQEIKTLRVYPEGSSLFERDAPADGFYLLEFGRVRMLYPTPMGWQVFSIRDKRGEVLGLAEVMSREAFRVTAKASERTGAYFVQRDKFLKLLNGSPDLRLQVLGILSGDLDSLYDAYRNVRWKPGRPRALEKRTITNLQE